MGKKITFEIDREDVCLPFTIESFVELFMVTTASLSNVRDILVKPLIIGIDTETRPSFMSRDRKPNPTSLLQIAARLESGKEVVLLIDLLDISSSADYLLELDDILLPILESNKIIKVGQGLANDFIELSSSYPSVKAFRRVESIIETNRLVRHLQPEVMQNLSLKAITRSYLHLNLVKTQQCSDWGLRPLSKAQTEYAARDALVLLRLYDVMTSEAEDMGSFSIAPLLTNYLPYESSNSTRCGADAMSNSLSCVPSIQVRESNATGGYDILIRSTKPPQHERFSDRILNAENDSCDEMDTIKADTPSDQHLIQLHESGCLREKDNDAEDGNEKDDEDLSVSSGYSNLTSNESIISVRSRSSSSRSSNDPPSGRLEKRKLSPSSWSPLHSTFHYSCRKNNKRMKKGLILDSR
jgi:hypothetical protein